ncbi:helix-turn-helix transcriptional regulator [Lysobacter alkalisoli]|uniref:Helix-turn-helix transcriptional regulator n=1 Tax=Marilutibacter alkalisoli TaxID=2591633 RepID=A0A514BND3_9GAMM|nr:helix-turn-helix transcriptional regulator [Lysobacter alkalisoli]
MAWRGWESVPRRWRAGWRKSSDSKLRHPDPGTPTPKHDHAHHRQGKMQKSLRYRRKGLGLTQVQLGELVDVTQQQIASFETGRRRTPISTLPLLARALGVSIEGLVGIPPRTRQARPGTEAAATTRTSAGIAQVQAAPGQRSPRLAARTSRALTSTPQQ